jgi:hypothetical protein
MVDFSTRKQSIDYPLKLPSLRYSFVLYSRLDSFPTVQYFLIKCFIRTPFRRTKLYLPSPHVFSLYETYKAPFKNLLNVYRQPQSRQSAKLFLQSSELGLPHSSPAGECALPPFAWGGEGHTHWRERGVGESQFRRGYIHCGTL